MQSHVSFVLDGKIVAIDFTDPRAPRPTTTVLNYLRSLPGRKGTKEGCAEGDCGACTVVVAERSGEEGGALRYRAVDSCLVFLPMLHGKQLITVEDLRPAVHGLHPVQEAMVETGGSQCGYCTPGFVMSLFSLYKSSRVPTREEIDDALTGNLCRCTGYRPIIEAAARACAAAPDHHAGAGAVRPAPAAGDDGGEEAARRLLAAIPRESLSIQTPLQRYCQPVSLGEALTLKHRHPDALVISGATDSALRVTKNHELLPEIIDLSAVGELKSISSDAGDCLSIGAGASLSEVMPSVREGFPALYAMLSVFGSRQIRNLATLGGNICTASPIGDTLPVLLAYGARVVLESINGRREVALERFITGYRKTVLKPDELLTAVLLPRPASSAIIRSYKVSKRKDLDISTVSGAFRLELEDGDETGTGRRVRSLLLAYGGMADRVKRAPGAEEFLSGKPWNRETVEKGMALVRLDFSPISDARAGAEMRRVAAGNLLLKFWADTRSDAAAVAPSGNGGDETPLEK